MAVVDALGQSTRTTRDFTTNQVIEVRHPLNRLTTFTYDLAGNVNSVLDPQQNPTIFEYEPTFNQVTKITDALNHTTTIAYSAFGQPANVTNPANNTTMFTYGAVYGKYGGSASTGEPTLAGLLMSWPFCQTSLATVVFTLPNYASISLHSLFC